MGPKTMYPPIYVYTPDLVMITAVFSRNSVMMTTSPKTRCVSDYVKRQENTPEAGGGSVEVRRG